MILLGKEVSCTLRKRKEGSSVRIFRILESFYVLLGKLANNLLCHLVKKHELFKWMQLKLIVFYVDSPREEIVYLFCEMTNFKRLY